MSIHNLPADLASEVRMKRSEAIPNYREQKTTLAHVCGELPSCSLCRYRYIWGTSVSKLYCNRLLAKFKKLNSRCRVSVYGLCDLFVWRKNDVNARPILGAVRDVRDEGSPPEELEVQAEHGGDSVEATSADAPKRDGGRSAARVGGANPLRITPEQKDKTLVVAIPQ